MEPSSVILERHFSRIVATADPSNISDDVIAQCAELTRMKFSCGLLICLKLQNEERRGQKRLQQQEQQRKVTCCALYCFSFLCNMPCLSESVTELYELLFLFLL